MPSIGVLEHYQKPTDKPTRRIKRSGGQSLVRQQAADWIVENVLLKLRREKDKSLQHLIKKGREIIRKSFIPDKLPSHKAPGTRTVGKVVEQDGYGRARIVLANMIAAGR